MSREKQGYRDTLALLNERFPNQDALNKTEVAQFLGRSTKTISRYCASGKLKFSPFGVVTKADLARQVCL